MKVAAALSQRYGLALVLLIIALVFTMAMPENEWLRVVAMALQGVALVATLSAADADRRLLRGFSIVYLICLVAAIVQAGATDSDGSGFFRASVLFVLLLTLPIVGIGVVRQVRRDRKITVQTMMGVLCAYLLLMSSFAYAYAVIGEFGSEPFFNQGPQWDSLGDYLYFSLITITTVGFGDLTPAGDLGRSLAAAEALIGQIYMVTIVAAIVANLGRSRPSPTEDGGSGAVDPLPGADSAEAGRVSREGEGRG